MKHIFAGLLVVGLFWSPINVIAEEQATMSVWKSPHCGCCAKWVEHMKKSGFKVDVKNIENMSMIKRMAGVADHLQSCHTAHIGGYTIEGHVPAHIVKRLLSERPKIKGIAVPGMPSGSPGMENGEHDPYDVIAFTKDGKTSIFSRHK